MIETTDHPSTELVPCYHIQGKCIVSLDIILSEKEDTTAGQIHKVGLEKIREHND